MEGFHAMINSMSSRPQDYISDRGRLTTNTVEGFHGLALMYRDKRTDLHHLHYTCKTNMAICHKVYTKNYIENAFMLLLHLQNLGPIWKIFCLISMGVEVPATAVVSVLNEQDKWEKDKVNRSSDKSRYKR